MWGIVALLSAAIVVLVVGLDPIVAAVADIAAVPAYAHIPSISSVVVVGVLLWGALASAQAAAVRRR